MKIIKNPTLDSEERVRCRRNTFCVLLSRRFMLEHFIIKRGLALFDGLLTFCYCWLCIAPLHSVSLSQFWFRFDWLLRLGSTLIFESFATIFSMKTTFEWFTMKFGMKVLETNNVHWSPFSPLQLALYYFRVTYFWQKKLLLGIAKKVPALLFTITDQTQLWHKVFRQFINVLSPDQPE